MKTLNDIITVVLVWTCFAFANTAYLPEKVPIHDLPKLTGSELVNTPIVHNVRIPMSTVYNTDQHIGEVDTVGTTWYDVQHNGTCGRMIRYDVYGNIHVCWMNGLDNGATNRHIYYNLLTRFGIWNWGQVGIAVESAQRGGYTCMGVETDVLSVDSTSYPFVAFHVIAGANPRAHSAVATDLFPGGGFFDYWELPYVYIGGIDLEVIWPRITVDRQARSHFISTHNDGTDASSMIYYCRGTYDAFNMTFIDQQPIDYVETIAADIAASRYTDRVAFVYTDIITSLQGDTNQYNNDLYLVVSEDGINWDFENPINITQFIPPDTNNPNPVLVNGDTLRVYTCASILFDQNDDIHVAFTTPGYYAVEQQISVNNSFIWHWSEDMWWTPALVADGWWGVGATCGAWQRYVQRPCLAEDEDSGDLFIVYQAYDTADVAANGYPQANIMVSRSIDNGFNWSVGTNITNTFAPGEVAGNCWHERNPSCSELVEDGSLHIFYVTDRDPGTPLQSEGAWTLNQCYYHNLPISEIPSTPLVPHQPFHVPVNEINPPKVPISFSLAQNYPNPFNPSTTIEFAVSHTDHITLKIYNTLGREIVTLVDANLTPDTYKVPFNADNLSSGIYFYTLESSTLTQTKKMVLLK